MIIDAIINCIIFFGAYFGIWGGWIVIISLVMYLCVCRLVRGAWRSPYSWFDILTALSMCVIWYHGAQHDFNHRGIGRFIDLMVMGGIYSVVLLFRIPFIWNHPQWRTKISFASFLILSLMAIIITWCINLGSE